MYNFDKKDDNNIVSIEQLQNNSLETVVNLRLDNNHITNLKVFRKFNFPVLQQLDLCISL